MMAGEGTIDAAAANRVDIWMILEKSIAAGAASAVSTPAAAPVESDADKARRRKSWRRWRRTADGLSTVAWIYVLMKLFVLDLDVKLLSALAPRHVGALDYRALIVLATIALIGVFFWRWKTLAAIAYIVFFPAIVLLWKLPRLLYQRRSWLAVMAAVNAVALALRNLRYNMVSKSIALVSGVVIMTSHSRPMVIAAAVYLSLLLIWSSARTVRRTIEPDWFLKTHKETIDRVVNSKAVVDFTSLSEEIKRGEVEVLNAMQLNTVTNAISGTVVLNRVLYFWAYQLQRYRQARLSVFFNAMTYAWLFFGATVTLWFVNLAVLRVFPSQFSFTAHPTNIAMLLYSLVSLALNEGGGVVAQGDVANLIRIFAGLYGPIFLAIFLFNVLFLWRQERDSESLASTVETLKVRAREQEARVRSNYNVSVEEARQRLKQLGQGFEWLVGWLTSSIPAEFLDEEPPRDVHPS